MTSSLTHLVIMPAYNTGPRLPEVVAEVLRYWHPVMVVVDGSTDGGEAPLIELARTERALTVLVLPRNSGKGAAVLAGAEVARARGFTHALVMDADGQHPAASIAEFMAASAGQPDTLVLGRPVFPANIPSERRHGRKLSVGLVRLEVGGPWVADPLFGFRIYPLAPLLAALGPRSGGRRYDFDTEAAVRLCWAGVPARNLSAPVRYFSRAEGGVSHFRYLQDNVTLVWMHMRLITELLLWRWPAVRRHGRRWRGASLWLALLVLPAVGWAGETALPADQEHRVTADAPGWRELAEGFGRRPDTIADFTERRFFPFKKEPVALQGEVRVSVARGLSLHYVTPAERIVILDELGVLIRAPDGEKAAPDDPRARAANDALRHILRFNFAALEKNFELYGQRDGEAWTLMLVPRTEALRRSVGRITVSGAGLTVRRIELRRTVRQYIEIIMGPARAPAAFTADELKTYFRP